MSLPLYRFGYIFVLCFCFTITPVWCLEAMSEEYSSWPEHTASDWMNGFSNEWTAEVEGGEEVAQLLALQLGYIYKGQVLGFPDTYVFAKDDHAVQRRTAEEHTARLRNDHRVRWAEQLFEKTRVKRDTYDPDRPLRRVKRLRELLMPIDELNNRQLFNDSKLLFNDELWSHEWYLHDTRTRGDLPRLDLNVLGVYRAGLSGRGVRVAVLDDGIEHEHTDLKDNYDPEISWDCNDGDPDPTPRYDEKRFNSHGTRCAGEIAMVANNVKCGVGVAWKARIGGIRMLDGRVTDRVEGEALGYAWKKVDIYSASWGPNDDGRTVEGPGRLAAAAILRGITKGRNGKGVIYVWASGNGGSHHDNCNCDGYSSSIYTVSIGSASQHGLFPWYGEICASTLATAYSSGAYRDQKIATTDIGDSCTLRHTGTSAAAPLAAGIIALALEANGELTWRDVQHLVVWTSEPAPLAANPGWQTNKAGLRFDVRFGFGLLDAGALVAAALNWTRVPAKTICRVRPSILDNTTLYTGASVDILFRVDDCAVSYLEHIELSVNIHYSRRGALEVDLTSAQGTKVNVLSSRPLDSSKAGFVDWPLTSVATWGENPSGLWRATVRDKTNESNSGVIGQFTLAVHGTEEIPKHMMNGPRIYNDLGEENSQAETESEALLQNVDSDHGLNYTGDLEPENSSEEYIQEMLEILNQPLEKQKVLLENYFNKVDPKFVYDLEKELLRIHHRMINLNSYN